MIQLFVRFETGYQGDLMGRIEAVVGGEVATHKIAFIERGYRGPLPKAGEDWVCEFLRDTQPSAHKGANIVRPLRRPTWGWAEVGEPVMGVRRREPVCEIPGVSSRLAPFTFAEQEAVNADYRAAEAKQRLWEGNPSEAFFALFGQPSSITVATDNNQQAVLSYPHGKKTVEAWVLEDVLGLRLHGTGTWEEQEQYGRYLKAEFVFENLSIKVWRIVACMGEKPSLTKYFDYLPLEVQNQLIPLIKAGIKSPEDHARKAWERDQGKTEELRKDLRALVGPGRAEFYRRSIHGATHSPESDDGYRAASTDYGMIEQVLMKVTWYPAENWGVFTPTPISTFQAVVSSSPRVDMGASKPLKTPDEYRAEYITRTQAALWKVIDSLGQDSITSASLDPRISDISAEEWYARFSAVRSPLLAQAIKTWAEEDAASVRDAYAVWKAYDIAAKRALVLRAEDSRLSNQVFMVGVTEPAPSVRYTTIGLIPQAELDEYVQALERRVAHLEASIGINRTPSPTPPSPVDAKPADQSAVAATLTALQGKFGKKR